MLGHLFLLWIGHFIETRFLQNIFHKNFQNILLHILHRSMPRASFKKMILKITVYLNGTLSKSLLIKCIVPFKVRYLKSMSYPGVFWQ